MGTDEFIKISKSIVTDYTNQHTQDIIINPDDVYVVWVCKTLQNLKALLSTTIADGMYYEITFNGDKSEIYFDAYKKFENRCVNVEEINNDK